jgi:hypothetical protein
MHMYHIVLSFRILDRELDISINERFCAGIFRMEIPPQLQKMDELAYHQQHDELSSSKQNTYVLQGVLK